MPSVCVGRAVIFLYGSGCSLPRLMFYYTICQVSVKTAYSVISALIISLEDM